MTTVNGRPVIEHDWEEEYRKQMKYRLSEVVSEYLQDEKISVLGFYNDLTDEIKSLVDYHKKHQEKAEGMLHLVNGTKPNSDFDCITGIPF